ncbi:hypothetical protein DPMN_017550 [Dreissena polymorpha]|uniref:Uncharacterized protein n=1 Tax=Dreissena polymorpha TaxID=45954 RepID=A0A9D4NBK5_DREPO|nr:hypothetical protein DPMN_017550 [Dreissena polymorpha]
MMERGQTSERTYKSTRNIRLKNLGIKRYSITTKIKLFTTIVKRKKYYFMKQRPFRTMSTNHNIIEVFTNTSLVKILKIRWPEKNHQRAIIDKNHKTSSRDVFYGKATPFSSLHSIRQCNISPGTPYEHEERAAKKLLAP